MAAASSTTRPPIPLTTIFTPPPTCSDVVTYDGTTFWQGGISQKGDPDCYPTSFRDIYNSFYTPGICPHLWTSVSGAGGPSVRQSTAFCCPPNYHLNQNPFADVIRNACASILTGDLTNVWSTSTLDDGAIPQTHPLTTVQKASLNQPTVWADIIQVRWNSNNPRVTSLLAQQTATTASSSSSPSQAAGASASPSSTSSLPQATSTTSPSSSSSSKSSSLSTGAEAGIGIGAAIGAVILAVLIFLFLRNRRRKRREPTYPETQPVNMKEEQKVPGYHEMPQEERGQNHPVEMDAANMGKIDGANMGKTDGAKMGKMDAANVGEMDGAQVGEMELGQGEMGKKGFGA